MVIYFGADHRGFLLKETLREFAREKGYEVADLGAAEQVESDDYVDYAVKVATKVSLDSTQRGILICGSGAGMEIVANKFRRVRATLGLSVDQVFDARHDDDVNLLCIASNFTNEFEAKRMLDVFIGTPFSKEERHARRLEKISEIENG